MDWSAGVSPAKPKIAENFFMKFSAILVFRCNIVGQARRLQSNYFTASQSFCSNAARSNFLISSAEDTRSSS